MSPELAMENQPYIRMGLCIRLSSGEHTDLSQFLSSEVPGVTLHPLRLQFLLTRLKNKSSYQISLPVIWH